MGVEVAGGKVGDAVGVAVTLKLGLALGLAVAVGEFDGLDVELNVTLTANGGNGGPSSP